MVSSKAFQKILVWSEVHQFLEDVRIEKIVLLNGKTRNMFFFCQMHLVSNLMAAIRGGRKNRQRADVRQPNIARSYNTYMGGFDMMCVGQTNLILPDIHMDQEMDNVCLCIFFEYGHLQCLDYVYSSLKQCKVPLKIDFL
ncbi:hypothetical protein TNCT_324631 [Trichonephila clavata]|uniref:Uncharacterized protein n=1 Tax=Trichonephila clavata TaxID=2740835 RepID=A0A8X6FJK4_TRICU|nr:hypothetical protein TNCT_324631 [Trichonephila clavata]